MEDSRPPTVWPGLELRHLVTLQAVAEAGSFGRAARRLGYTQSAVSQQIATLEALVCERLLERARGTVGVVPTAPGRLLLGHAEAILARLRAAEADFTAYTSGEAGVLRVGTFESVGTHVLPELVRQFSTDWPRIEVRPTESSSDERLLSLVEGGELDLTFALLPLPAGPFQAVELLHDPYALVVPVGSPLARQATPPNLDEIVRYPLVGFQHCRTGAQVETYLRGKGAEPRVVFRSDNNGTVQGMVAAGIGVALMPRLTIDERDERVEVLSLGSAAPERWICLVWHRNRYRSPAARAFAQFAQRRYEGRPVPLAESSDSMDAALVLSTLTD